MTAKKWLVVGLVCLSIIASYQAGKLAGEHSVKSILAKQKLAFQKEELAFRKEMEATRIKEAEENYRWLAIEKRKDRTYEALRDSSNRQTAAMLSAIQAMTDGVERMTPNLSGIPSIPELMREQGGPRQ